MTRNFAVIPRDILDDDDYLSLDPDHMHVWLVLCLTRTGGKCGIFRGHLALCRDSQRSTEIVLAALEAFAQRGWVERDRDWTWVRDRIELQGNSPNWKRDALREAGSWTGETALAQRCLERYAADGLEADE